MQKMKIVIADDNPQRREQIKGYMPSYAEGIAVGFGDAAMQAIIPDKEGNVPDIVIMNGDDKKGLGLYLFDWMRNKSHDPLVMGIPVMVLTEDEFSDRSIDFLDIDDVSFYEGEVDEDRIYSAMMEALDRDEFTPVKTEPVYSDEKGFERIGGKSIKIKGEPKGRKRSLVLDMDTQLDSLEAALERGRAKNEKIRRLLSAAADYKGARKNEKKRYFLDKIRVEQGKKPLGDEPTGDYNEDDIPEEFRMTAEKADIARVNVKNSINNSLNALGDKMLMNPQEAQAAQQGVAGLAKKFTGNMNDAAAARKPTEVVKKTVVVVDDEAKDRSACEIFLSTKYNIVTLDSGMKAIDYFIKNKADLMLLDTYMPNLGGVQTLASVRWQPNGKEVPVIYLIDKRHPVAVNSLQGSYVAGVLYKPLTPGVLAMSIDGFFRNQGK